MFSGFPLSPKLCFACLAFRGGRRGLNRMRTRGSSFFATQPFRKYETQKNPTDDRRLLSTISTQAESPVMARFYVGCCGRSYLLCFDFALCRAVSSSWRCTAALTFCSSPTGARRPPSPFCGCNHREKSTVISS